MFTLITVTVISLSYKREWSLWHLYSDMLLYIQYMLSFKPKFNVQQWIFQHNKCFLHWILIVFLSTVFLSWHFILPVRFSHQGLLRMRTSILHPFSHAEQQYLMYLHYCKDRFRVGVGVDVNKTQSNRRSFSKYLNFQDGLLCKNGNARVNLWHLQIRIWP